MHKFLRAAGFHIYQKKRDIEKLLDRLVEESEGRKRIWLEPDTNLCEIRAEVAPGLGVVIIGEMDRDGVFQREYYYPYLAGMDMSSSSECTVQRHTEKETYAGLLDEYRVGISLIFYLDNMMEYRERLLDKESVLIKEVSLSGFSVDGKILLPLHKTDKQREVAQVAAKDRNILLEAAKNGDEDAMETLTIEDIDMYSQIARRVMKEDIYSIIDSCFMPCGVECDQYSIIGEITHVETLINKITEEEVYDLTLDCSDLTFHVAISRQDLLGEPEVGRRFKGQIWMQGTVSF